MVNYDVAMFASMVEKLRAEKRLSQHRLAESAGVSRGTILNVEAEVPVSNMTRRLIADALGCSLAYLETGRSSREDILSGISERYLKLSCTFDTEAFNKGLSELVTFIEMSGKDKY